MSVLDEIIKFITSGSIGGIPTIVVMLIPFILGLVVGYLAHKMLKIAIIAGIILVIVAYFGFFGLSLGELTSLATTYGPSALHYATLLIGILPLTLGFIIGAVVGFILS